MNKSYMVIIEIIVVILVAIYSVLTWHFFGRDPKRKTVIPEFNVPDNISAMFIAYINGERDSIRILKIGILSLLSKNYISVIKDKKGKIKKFILNNKNKKNLELRKTNLFEEENELLDTLSEGDLFSNKQLILKYKKMKQKRKLQVLNPAEMRPLTGGGTVFKCSKTGDTILCNWMADVTACKSFEAKCPSGFIKQLPKLAPFGWFALLALMTSDMLSSKPL